MLLLLLLLSVVLGLRNDGGWSPRQLSSSPPAQPPTHLHCCCCCVHSHDVCQVGDQVGGEAVVGQALTKLIACGVWGCGCVGVCVWVCVGGSKGWRRW
jgi:hypothetical protein